MRDIELRQRASPSVVLLHSLSLCFENSKATAYHRLVCVVRARVQVNEQSLREELDEIQANLKRILEQLREEKAARQLRRASVRAHCQEIEWRMDEGAAADESSD